MDETKVIVELPEVMDILSSSDEVFERVEERRSSSVRTTEKSRGIDVILLTKNSVEPCLDKCLDSLGRNVDINRLIVVDGGSTDGTLDIIRNFCSFRNVDLLILCDMDGNRATARQLGIENVSTDWFMFLDSDIILSENWLDNARSHIQDDVGAIEGRHINVSSTLVGFDEAMLKLRKMVRGRTVGFGNKKSLGTHRERSPFAGDLLVRTESLIGIKIPPVLHVYEDYYLKSFIECRGYAWLTDREEPHCIHDCSRNIRPKDYYYKGFIQSLEGMTDPKTRLFSFLKALLISVWVLAYTGNFDVVRFYVSSMLQYLLGCLHFSFRKDLWRERIFGWKG